MPSLEPFHPRVWVLMQRTSSFVADGITPGFTVRYAHPPRSPQHLTHGLAALHVLRLSLSFGPSRSPSGLVGLVLPLLRPLLTSRSGSSRRPFRHKARSPQVRVAHLHRTTAAFTPPRLGHKSFAVMGLLALLGNAFYAVLVHRLTIYAPRFLPTLGRPHAVALHFAHCDQLAAGLAPAGVRPCWAHIGIGGLPDGRHPCHTTRHAGPHRAVRALEVRTALAPPADQSTQWSALA